MAVNAAKRVVGYVHNDVCLIRLSSHPKVSRRGYLVYELTKAYGLLDSVQIINPVLASSDVLKSFHSADYVDYLYKANSLSNEELDDKYDDDETEEFGLGYDCPLIPGLFDVASAIGGSTVSAASELTDGNCTVVVNWYGGWHHAKRDEAAGFCYVNDVVLGILQLLNKFRKVLYVDLDLHHGDGVDAAFSHTDRVLCFSVHKYEEGFFPGTGDLYDIGCGKGEFYSVNVPLFEGVNDVQFTNLVVPLLRKAYECFSPDVVVCQCGADTLAGDPLASFNLTLKPIGACIIELLSWNIPLMLLGGGGYNFPNTARLWTYLLSLVIGQDLPCDLPDNKYLLKYGPDYELHITPRNMMNHNTDDHLKMVMDTVLENLEEIS